MSDPEGASVLEYSGAMSENVGFLRMSDPGKSENFCKF